MHPTILPAVPRIYEKIHAGVLDQIESAGGLKRKLGLWALGVGARASRLRRARPAGACTARGCRSGSPTSSSSRR